MNILPKRIKLMPDYKCWCLWDMDANESRPYNINPETLPLSNELKEKLSNWEDTYDNLLIEDDPSKSGFKTSEEVKYFNEIGWKLLDCLRKELPMIEFYYFDNEQGKLLK